MAALYIGVMTGTSLDGIDCALCEINEGKTLVVAHLQQNFCEQLRSQLLSLCSPGDNEIERMLQADIALADTISNAINTLLLEQNLKPTDISAIGCHGQTIRHRPPSAAQRRGITLQIGDLSTISAHCAITCIGDFRRADMARGGQGAPIAPAFHAALLQPLETNQGIVNIGGMANISIKKPKAPIHGFDTGPGNVLLDSWIQSHQGHSYDHAGGWAKSGQLNHPLLLRLMQHPYIKQAAPKSTGREQFNLSWLTEVLSEQQVALASEDVQRTLLEFTALSISEVASDASLSKLFVCGGGAENEFLMQRIQALLPTCTVTTSTALGVDPQHMEAAAFAWFAHQTLNNKPLDLKNVTGATANGIAGLIHTPI